MGTTQGEILESGCRKCGSLTQARSGQLHVVGVGYTDTITLEITECLELNCGQITVVDWGSVGSCLWYFGDKIVVIVDEELRTL